jgi:hypothetical protein
MSQAEIVEIASGDNLIPTAQDDFYGTAENSSLTVSTVSGVLANDDDPDGDPLEARLLTDVSAGTLALAGDGSFTYSPATEFSGIDSFSYETFDGRSPSNAATVMIDVTATENAPVSNADSYRTD